MKARLITNGIISLMAAVAYVLFIILVLRTNFFSGAILIVRNILIGISIVVSFVMGIITLAMKKHESARGLTIASGVIGILAIFVIPILVNWIISFIGVYKINQAEKEIIEEQEIAAATNQTEQATSEESPSA